MAIKILHTADLHFGKKLHGFDLADQQILYVRWLTSFIELEKIAYLLIAGDVFDLANPSSESMKMYYGMLKDISDLGCKIIITAGNHDSAALLHAPADLLKAFNITVIGIPPEDPADCLVPVMEGMNVVAHVAAVPYLRDADIRRSISGESYHDKLRAVREGIKAYYDRIAEYALDKHPGVPLLASGHLYSAGAEGSESEREIQIGNLAGIDASAFHESYRYVALGHIHKPQQVGGLNRIWYSGSPYPLSFSERSQKKYIRVITVDQGEVTSDSFETPVFRDLLRFSGTLDEISKQVSSYTASGSLLSLAEMEVREETFDTSVLACKENMISEINERDDLRVIFSKIEFRNQLSVDQSIDYTAEELTPLSVFKNLINALDEEKQMELLVAFAELTETLNGDQES